jgi:hypothetical protein
MRRILQFLAADGSFLYEQHGFRIIDSKYSNEFGGTGSVTLSNDIVEVRLWLERHLLFMDMRAAGRRSARPWFSTDILRQMLMGQINDKSVMDEENVDFLRANSSEQQARFDRDHVSATEAACKELKNQRAKRLFG